MAKLFLITYNESSLPKKTLIDIFDKSTGVITWFSQMPGSFFIKTDDSFTAESISSLVEDKGGTVNHVVVKVQNKVSEDYYGRLSKELWEHFK